MAKYRKKIAKKLARHAPGMRINSLSCEECRLVKKCTQLVKQGKLVCCELTDRQADIRPYGEKPVKDAWLSRMHEDVRQEEDVFGLTLEQATELLGYQPYEND